jgi:hypothetical protein
MPRNYVPRQKTYTELQLQQALDKVKNGELSFREAESNLKRSKKIFFVYPDTHIMYTVHKYEDVIKLSAPMQKSKRGPLMFDIDFEKYQVELFQSVLYLD